MTWIICTFVVGVFLSAFFSGTETGFYRVTRFRLAIDGLSGDPISRSLLWLTNNPALFVATTLIGNNLANYLTSRSIVQATQHLIGGNQIAGNIVVPLLVSPFVFVYGELLPKNLFYLAPNKLLRMGGPLFLACGVVFAPISAMLWVMSRGLQWLVGESPEILRLRLARNELQKVIDEGHEVGILHASQRSLSHSVIEVANDAVARYCTPSSRMSSILASATRSDVVRLARRHRTSTLLVTGDSSRDISGYIRVVDVHLSDYDWNAAIRPLIEIHQDASHLTALLRLQTEHEPLARVVDSQGRDIGIIQAGELVKGLFGDAV